MSRWLTTAETSLPGMLSGSPGSSKWLGGPLWEVSVAEQKPPGLYILSAQKPPHVACPSQLASLLG